MTSTSDQIVEVMAEGIRAQGVISTLSAYAVANIALSALKQAGWRVVPTEPTSDMLEAMGQAIHNEREGAKHDWFHAARLDEAQEAYRAMLQAQEEEQGLSQVTNDRSVVDVGPQPHAITEVEPTVRMGEPWRIMTREEFAALTIRGSIAVVNDYDGCGGVAVWLMGDSGEAVPSQVEGEGSREEPKHDLKSILEGGEG